MPMRVLDLTIVVLYLVLVTWLGARFRKHQSSLRDYFLGGRRIPWWAVALSIVSAETSTLTIIGTPALAFSGNLGFLQVVLGYLVARIIISVLFLPHYFRGELLTAYQLMQARFGESIRRLTAGLFLVLRALAEGVRVFAISIVVAVVLGTGDLASIALIVGLTVFYTFEGGLAAVIWTEVAQMFLYIAGGLVSFFWVVHLAPGGWAAIWETASQAGKLEVFDFSWEWSREFFSRPYTFWAGLLGGAFLTTASHGTEQLIVQRLLAARTLTESRLALLSSWVVICFQFTVFLLIGVVLYVLYEAWNLPPPQPMDRLYPEFVWNHLPTGVAGLVIAAVVAAAMSNLSAALNALASTTVVDFLQPWLTPPKDHHRSEPDWLWVSRWVTLAWGILLFGIGWLARKWGSVLEAGLSVASVLYGSLLGVFLLGVLTRNVGPRAARVAMIAGFLTMTYVKFATQIAWTWYVLIGTTVTFLSGWLGSRWIREVQQ